MSDVMRGFLGTCGSGKTFTMRAHVDANLRTNGGPRFVILDPNREFPGDAGQFRGLRYTPCATVAEGVAAVQAGRAFVVVHPTDADLGPDGRVPYAPAADALGAAAVEARDTVILGLPEAHQSCREHLPLPPAVHKIAHRYRHVRAGVFWDTQHPQDVSKDLVRATTWLGLFATASARDLQWCRQLGGPELAAAVDECGRRAAAGEKGWHVPLGTLDRRPPYRLTRVGA